MTSEANSQSHDRTVTDFNVITNGRDLSPYTTWDQVLNMYFCQRINNIMITMLYSISFYTILNMYFCQNKLY